MFLIADVIPLTCVVSMSTFPSVAIGGRLGWPKEAETESRHSGDPKIVAVDVNKNTRIFMTFAMPPL